MINYGSQYQVPAMSRKALRGLAVEIRKIFNINSAYFPVTKILESLTVIGIDYDYIEDNDWEKEYGKEKHAEFSLNEKIIRIKESVYENAVNNNGRDRFTITHEIAHAILLDLPEIKLAREFDVHGKNLCRNPEWQADCLAGELLVPFDKCATLSPEEISLECKVSLSAAKYQKSRF